MTLGETLGIASVDNQDSRHQLAEDSGDTQEVPEFTSDELTIANTRVIEKKTDVASAAISAGSRSFLLSNPLAAVLGTNKLGIGTTIITTERVYNNNDTWDETFSNVRFLGSDDTSTWATTGSITFTIASNDTVETAAIYKDTSTLTNATVSATYTGSIPILTLSPDGGSNWESVTLGSSLSFTNTGGSELLLRMNNASENIVITDIAVIYAKSL